MKEAYRIILDSIAQGKIEKQIGVKLINTIKQQNDKKCLDVAVIGIGLKFPMAEDIEEYWSNIKNKVDCIKSLPVERANHIKKYLKHKGMSEEDIKLYKLGCLDGLDEFDYDFFKLSPKEAELMDPNQRLFLETAWHAIEDAGYSGKRITGTKTGIYIGFEGSLLDNYANMIYEAETSSLQYAIPSNLSSIISGRLSYLLNLKGPSLLVDCACSSSLIAVDLACQALYTGSCKMAIAGGVRLNLVPIEREVSLGIEASDGRTRAFDNNTGGTGEGEGVAAVLLKPLESALADGDNIYAVIKGSASNQDGSSVGITAPNPSAQTDVILAAWEKTGIDPETISYIEAHGTGTRLGDPIEIKGITNAFRRHTTKKQFCAISSVKSSTGHLFECSGMASLIKVSLAIKHRYIPPMAHFNLPNNEIDFCQTPVYVSTKGKNFEKSSIPMRCGISAFGISGTNCHVVMEEAPARTENNSITNAEYRVFTISASSKNSLIKLITSYKEFIDKNDYNIESLCFTALTGREHYNHRIAFVIESKEDISRKLNAINLDNLCTIDAEGIYYGLFKIVENNRPDLGEHDITSYTKKDLTSKAKEKLLKYLQEGEKIDIEDVCVLYSKGADVEWEMLYEEKKCQKISLPVYPFDHKKCWIHIPDVIENTDIDNVFFKIAWKKNNDYLLGLNNHSNYIGNTLIFKDTEGVALKLISSLEEEGARVTCVEFGNSYKKIDDKNYIIDGNENDYRKLFDDLGQESFTHLIHLSSISNKSDIDELNVLEEKLKKGIYCIHYLIKEMAERKHNVKTNLTIITTNASEVTGNEEFINPENASMMAIGKVIPQELFNISCRCIDAEYGIDNTLLLKEIKNIMGNSHVSYRDSKAYLGELKRADIDTINKASNIIKDDGVYIITGGAGGLGIETAKYLASKARVKLAVLSRSGFPSVSEWNNILKENSNKKTCEAILKFKEIMSNGSELHFFKVDVSNYKVLSEIIDSIRGSLGKIDGIIHGAGVSSNGLTVEKKMKDIEEVIAPKIFGTWNLERLTRQDKLDFFVMYSSIASLMGGPGQADYAAANAYLDSFAYCMQKRGINALAINWAPWEETGMWLQRQTKSEAIFEALSTKNAIMALDLAIGKETGNLIIGSLNYLHDEMEYFIEKSPYLFSSEINNKINSLRAKGKINLNSDIYNDFKLTGRKGDNEYTDCERKVAAIWNRIFGHKEISIYDNYYEIGGDSIKGLKIINHINMEMGLDLKISDLLTHLTIVEFAELIEEKSNKLTRTNNLYSDFKPAEEMEYYPLSAAQTRVFVANSLMEGDTSYNITRVFEIQGLFDVDKIKNALSEIVTRHDSLRTGFELLNGQPVQRIHKKIDLQIEYSDSNDEDIDSQLKEFVKAYDLSCPPLLRVKILKVNESKHILAFDMHHIITDGASMDVIIEEIAKLYKGESLEGQVYQYKDYAVWHNRVLKDDSSSASAILKVQGDYWMDKLCNEIPTLNLYTDYERPKTPTFKGSEVRFNLDEGITKKINKIAKQTNTTLYMLLLAAYNTLLYRYSGNEDIIVGSPVVGRQCASLERVVGMFVNTLPMRSFPSNTKTFSSFLNEVKEGCLAAYENQDYQFDSIVKNLKIKRDVSRNLLFDTMFSLQNVGVSQFDVEGIRFISYPFVSGSVKFDLNLEARERDGGLYFRLEYRTDLFKEETAKRLAEDLGGILEFIAEEIEVTLGDIPLKSCKDTIIKQSCDEDIEFNF